MTTQILKEKQRCVLSERGCITVCIIYVVYLTIQLILAHKSIFHICTLEDLQRIRTGFSPHLSASKCSRHYGSLHIRCCRYTGWFWARGGIMMEQTHHNFEGTQTQSNASLSSWILDYYIIAEASIIRSLHYQKPLDHFISSWERSCGRHCVNIGLLHRQYSIAHTPDNNRPTHCSAWCSKGSPAVLKQISSLEFVLGRQQD